MESLQECSTCLEENDFSALACDARCDNQSQNILDMISDIGGDGMTYSGMMKRGKWVTSLEINKTKIKNHVFLSKI